MNSDGIFTGTAGVYHVMSELSLRKFHAAATHGNAPDFDILVCSADGNKAAAIQVKSTLWAARKNTFDFPLSYRAAKMSRETFFVAFVDFAGHENQKPNIYLVPSAKLYEACAPWIDNCKGKMIRFKPPLEWMKVFNVKDNNWSVLEAAGIAPSKPHVDEGENNSAQSTEADPSTSSG